MKHLKLALLSAALGSVILALPAAAQECAKKPVVVGLLPKLDTDPYFQVAKGGAEEAAKEIGGSVIQAAPSQATAEAQIEFINNFVAQKVGVIAIAGNDANAVAPALKRAAKEGIRVISYDSGVATEARQIFVNQVKGESLAEMMLISMHDLIGGEGEFAILSSTATATNQNAWIDFMKAKIVSDPKFAKMKLVQVAYGEESEQVNQQQALVQAFPNLKGIIVPAGIGLPQRRRPRAGWHAHQSEAHRTGPGDADEEVHPRRRGAGHLVERHRPRLSDLSSRPAGGDVQDHRQGRREVHRWPAWRLRGRQGRRGGSRTGKDRDAAECR
jgi:rhamnose transport system substrate-binding protein